MREGCETRTGECGAGEARWVETRGDESRETRTNCGAAFANARSAGMIAPDDKAIARRPLVPPPITCRGSVRVARPDDMKTLAQVFSSHDTRTLGPAQIL